MGVNSLPKTVTLQRRGCDLNPGPTAPESSTLTTRLPSHRAVYRGGSFPLPLRHFSPPCRTLRSRTRVYFITSLASCNYRRVANIRISAHFTHLRKFRNFVFATEMTIFSDHNPLMYLRECAPKSAKLTRWVNKRQC